MQSGGGGQVTMLITHDQQDSRGVSAGRKINMWSGVIYNPPKNGPFGQGLFIISRGCSRLPPIGLDHFLRS